MKLKTAIFSLCYLANSIAASDYFGEAELDNDLKSFELDYFIEEHPHVKHDEVVTINVGEQIKLNYTLFNYEQSDITIVGLGGPFVTHWPVRTW